MPIIKFYSTFTFDNINVDTSNIDSECHTISFENYGDDDCDLITNGTSRVLKAGASITLGGRDIEIICTDVFQISFAGVGTAPGVNVDRETINLNE